MNRSCKNNIENAIFLQLVFEGLWTNVTHPKNFPDPAYLTHFSDMVGASHETNFSFWGRDIVASDGFRQLAEWGSASGLEAELRTKAKYLKTYIKVPGLWYPHVNTNTTSDFRRVLCTFCGACVCVILDFSFTFVCNGRIRFGWARNEIRGLREEIMVTCWMQ